MVVTQLGVHCKVYKCLHIRCTRDKCCVRYLREMATLLGPIFSILNHIYLSVKSLCLVLLNLVQHRFCVPPGSHRRKDFPEPLSHPPLRCRVAIWPTKPVRTSSPTEAPGWISVCRRANRLGREVQLILLLWTGKNESSAKMVAKRRNKKEEEEGDTVSSHAYKLSTSSRRTNMANKTKKCM